MPLLQRIEISNFLNSRRVSPWKPDWAHQVIDLNGHNTAINIPNGKGKTTLFSSILALLLHDKKTLNKIRENFFSPNPSEGQHFTHIRIQVLIPTQGSTDDLLAVNGGDAGGEPLVLGMYGYGYSEGKVDLYAYQGTFEDCPVATVNKHTHTLTGDDAFIARLKQAKGVFRDKSKRDWLSYVETFFDMPSLRQQMHYQSLKGAEGGKGYFDVNLPSHMDYSAAVFYERLAPELLVDVMGDFGEEGERGIEDTIHEKVSGVIRAKYETSRKADELRRAENTLREFRDLLATGEHLKTSRDDFEKNLVGYSIEAVALKEAVVDHPLPGIPATPPESVPALARNMVLQGGQWFIPDRVMAEFTNEPPSEVNRRAHERNGIPLTEAQSIQVIDFTCHQKIRDSRGRASKLYSKDSALALLGITNNFTPDWSRERAIEEVTLAFDWVQAHADTNPARLVRLAEEERLTRLNEERKKLDERSALNRTQRAALEKEQQKLSDGGQSYQSMERSRLFTADELNEPAMTGEQVVRNVKAAEQSLELHRNRQSKLRDIYARWQQYTHTYGSSDSPGQQADALEANKQAATQAWNRIDEDVRQANKDEKDWIQREQSAKNAAQVASDHHRRFVEAEPSLHRFVALFGDTDPTGLDRRVVTERDDLKSSMEKMREELSTMGESVAAYIQFRQLHGEIEPAAWLADRQSHWERVGIEISDLRKALEEARIHREALDKSVIVAGKVTREAKAVAGGKHLSLHEVVNQLDIDHARRIRALTLFSALLHAPVYASHEEAAEAAKRLEEAHIEAPVFVRPALEYFLRHGDVTWDATTAHTWLLGIKTRQVEVLLDPSLVEREKRLADDRIASIEGDLQQRIAERGEYDPESDASKVARRAKEAIERQWPQKHQDVSQAMADADKRLPALEARASQSVLEDIRTTQRIRKEFGQSSAESLQSALEAARQSLEEATRRLGEVRVQSGKVEEQAKTAKESFQRAVEEAGKADNLRKIQRFMDDPVDNPSFMKRADGIEQSLYLAYKTAHERSGFDFSQADIFVKSGRSRLKAIIEELQTLKDDDLDIQDRIIPHLARSQNIIQEKILALRGLEGEVDQFARNLIRRYREFKGEEAETTHVTPEQVAHHPLAIASKKIQNANSPDVLLELLPKFMNLVDLEGVTGLRESMMSARAVYKQAESEFAIKVDKALGVADVDMSDHVRMELHRSKARPELIEHLHGAALHNFERNRAANEIAKGHLDEEWGNLGKWLEAFTLRLPQNLALMKKVFAPMKSHSSGDLSAGFHIEASLADRSDIRAVLDEVVSMVEKSEASSRALEHVAAGLREQAKRNLRAQIRSTFYEKIIPNPRIKVFMPSLSERDLHLKKDMVSTGQGVAMTLLWIVKMAEYVTERELRRLTTSRAQQNRIHRTQFALIDGAFSSLSHEGLIRDALNTIKRTRGRFQLIISGHDVNYQNNFEYFPVLVRGREMSDGEFMYADVETNRLMQPEEVGSHYGAMEILKIQATPAVH